MRVIVLQNEAMIADVICGQEALFIGSREGCRIHLNDARIAAQQAVLYPDANGGWLLEQLDTRCEIRVNGTLVVDKATLSNADEVQCGDYLLRIYPEFADAAPARTAIGTSRAALERFAQARLPVGAILKKTDEPLTVLPGQLDIVGRTVVALAGIATVPELMDHALRTFVATFAAQRSWIGLRRVNYGPMEYEEGRLITGQPTDLSEIGHELKPRILDRSQYILVPVVSATDRTSILAGPLVGPEGVLGMVYLDSGDSGRRFDMRELDYFVLLMSVFAYQLDAIFKATARARAAMIEGQVSVAHEIQSRLTPRKLPQWEGELQFGAFREPGRERTGNMYDIVRLANHNAAVLICHTPAGGALPSMLMAQAQTAFRSAGMHLDAPNVFLRMLNWILYDGQKDHALECFAGYLDPKSGLLQYAIAGRELGAYIIGQRGEERPLGTDEPDPALSLNKTAEYPLLTEQLESGETLVLFTPGVTTAKNRQEETFGHDRFVNILCDGFGQLASVMLKEMLSDLRNFTEGGAQPDDITVILAHRL
ncbi:MAG: SpoIIE family protein phosphatase [Phycisphaerales bacterium]|nr:SpoIIE family protein phosphatase [Phycisphaerales bacterium]